MKLEIDTSDAVLDSVINYDECPFTHPHDGVCIKSITVWRVS